MNQDSLPKQKNELIFKALFSTATIGIVVADNTGKITLINNFAEQQFGYGHNELLGKQVESLMPARYIGKHVNLRNAFIKKPENRPMGVGLDLLGEKRDGSEFPVEISLSHYCLENDTFVIAFITDITIRKQNESAILKQQEIMMKYAEEVNHLNRDLEKRVEERTLALSETLKQLKKSKDELEKSLSKERELGDLKSRFVSMASHEFRTPLSTILSSATLIEKYLREDEQDKRKRHVSRIKDNVKNLTDILEDFLSLGKLEEGLITINKSELNIKEFVNEILHDFNEFKKPLQQIIYSHSGTQTLLEDKILLKNILINLVSNAIKFSAGDGKIEVKTSLDKDELGIIVKDYGIGISKEDQKHLFDRFFRGKNALNIKGTGLGLHIVAKYVELIGGSIRYKTKLDHGTEFAITLPHQIPA